MSTNFSFSTSQSGSSFGSGNQNQNAPVSGATLFEKLPQEFQKNLISVQCDFPCKKRVKSEEIAQRRVFSGKSAEEDIGFLTDRVNTLKNSVQLFSEKVELTKKDVETATKNAEMAMRSIERLKTPYARMTEHPNPYFWTLLAAFEERMLQYRQVIADIEKFLDSRAQQRPYTSQMLKDIMQSQHSFFISLASQVAQIHDNVEDFKEKFLQYRKKFHDDHSDPFEVKKHPHTIPRFRPQPLIHLQQQQQQQQQQQNNQSSSGGFSFGNSGSGGSSSGGFSFGGSSSSSSSSGGFSFGSSSSASSSSGGGFSFGSSSGSGGSSGSSGGGFSFGGSSSSSSSGSGGGFSFGGSASSGSSGGGGFSFGSSSQSSSSGGFSFGGASSGSSGGGASGFTFGS